MTAAARRPARIRSLRPAAFTLAEVAVSAIIVSTMLVAALQAVAAARFGMQRLSAHTRGMLLAQDLVAEILQQAYADPAAGPDSFGLGADEAAAGNRSLYDDVDDYNGWSASPPQTKDGSEISWASDYQRSVVVAWVNPNDLGQQVFAPTGVKRIQVTVKHDGAVVATLHAVRTLGWDTAGAVPGGGGS